MIKAMLRQRKPPVAAPAAPTEWTPPPWPGPYLGVTDGWPVCAGPQTSLLVLGPPAPERPPAS